TRAGTPCQNLTLADNRGGIAWTIIGHIPRRVGFSGQLPTSWADGTRHWDGWVPAHDYPRGLDPAEGIIWTANNRVVGEPWMSRIGRGHFDLGARAKQIRDDLRSRERLAEGDMLAIQLDDRALFLSRWRRLLLEVLSEEVVRKDSQL